MITIAKWFSNFVFANLQCYTVRLTEDPFVYFGQIILPEILVANIRKGEWSTANFETAQMFTTAKPS